MLHCIFTWKLLQVSKIMFGFTEASFMTLISVLHKAENTCFCMCLHHADFKCT